MTTTFVYGAHPTSVVALTPQPHSIELAITRFDIQGRTTTQCLLDLDEFRTLLADGAAVLTDAAIARYCDEGHDSD